jgi:hypothetical protein
MKILKHNKVNSDITYPCGCCIGFSSKYEKDKAKQKIESNDIELPVDVGIDDIVFCKGHMQEIKDRTFKVIKNQIEISGDFK